MEKHWRGRNWGWGGGWRPFVGPNPYVLYNPVVVRVDVARVAEPFATSNFNSSVPWSAQWIVLRGAGYTRCYSEGLSVLNALELRLDAPAMGIWRHELARKLSEATGRYIPDGVPSRDTMREIVAAISGNRVGEIRAEQIELPESTEPFPWGRRPPTPNRVIQGTQDYFRCTVAPGGAIGAVRYSGSKPMTEEEKARIEAQQAASSSLTCPCGGKGIL